MSAIVRVTTTPPAAAKRWFCPSRSANLAWPTSPREIATTGDQREAGPKAEDQGAQGDGHHTDRDQQSFRSHGVYELAAGYLTYQTGDAAYAKDKSDVLGRPLPRRQISGGNGSKGSLHTGQKEVQPA